MPRATTDADTMALKALLEPRKMHPKMMTRIKVNQSAFNGTSSRLSTFAKNFEAGRPRSRAKAYTIRLLVVMILTAANCWTILLALTTSPSSRPRVRVGKSGTHQQAHQRKHQQADRSCFIVGRVIEDLQHRTSRGTDDSVEIAGNEEQDTQIDETGKDPDQHACYHDARPIHDRIVQFFDAMSDCVKAGQTELDEDQHCDGGAKKYRLYSP